MLSQFLKLAMTDFILRQIKHGLQFRLTPRENFTYNTVASLPKNLIYEFQSLFFMHRIGCCTTRVE